MLQLEPRNRASDGFGPTEQFFLSNTSESGINWKIETGRHEMHKPQEGKPKTTGNRTAGREKWLGGAQRCNIPGKMREFVSFEAVNTYV